MFWWLFGKKRVDKLETEIKKAFSDVKSDFDGVGKWVKHLHSKDKQHHGHVSDLKREIASIKHELEELKEHVHFAKFAHESKQLSKKTAVGDKQTAVQAVYNTVQTPVQTGNLYEILQSFSSNERLLVYTLLNTSGEMKLSYEDLARLLGKERSTVRGQINSIKQKSDGLIQEIVEASGKKRVYISEEAKEKLSKYSKVRSGKSKEKGKSEEEEFVEIEESEDE